MQRWCAVLFAMNVCLLTTAAALHLLAPCEYVSSYRNAFHFTDTLSGFHVECACSNCKDRCSFLSSQIPTPLFPLQHSTDGKQLSGPLLFKAFAANQAPKRENLMYCHSFGIQCQKWCNLSTFRSTCESMVYEQDLHLPFFLGFAFALGLLLLGLCGKVKALEMEMSKRSSCPTSTGTQSHLWGCRSPYLGTVEVQGQLGDPGSNRFVTGFADENALVQGGADAVMLGVVKSSEQRCHHWRKAI